VAASVGLAFVHTPGTLGNFYMPEIMGSGAALIDFDNDGDLDVYLIQGASEQPGNRLFRNELIPSGTLRFAAVKGAEGRAGTGWGMGAATGDYDNDGDWDLYVTNFGSNILYRNDGNGAFTDATAEAGVDDPRWSAGAAFLDYDRDGDLDLFVANYLNFTVKGNKHCYAPTGERDYCAPKSYAPVSSRLFQNQGNGRFKDVSAASGIASAPSPALGVAAADFNGDGWTDLYVANDGAANHLWLNQRNGAFKESALESGAAYSMDGLAKAGMGIAAADFDQDGDDDVLVTNLTREGATLYRNEGKGNFHDASLEAGVLQPSFRSTGFGVEWFDYDNDGLLDLFMANGAVTLLENLRGEPYPFHQSNQLFRNNGPVSAPKFVETTAEAGPALALSEVSRAATFGDLDNDGDIDILVTNNNGPVRLLLNRIGARKAWLQIELEATGGNRHALGARVALAREGRATLWRRVHTDSSYLAASDPRVHFGLGEDAKPVTVTVHWPGGSIETWHGLQPNTGVKLRQGTGASK
jgi:enediyne biosynthesis protein E4